MFLCNYKRVFDSLLAGDNQYNKIIDRNSHKTYKDTHRLYIQTTVRTHEPSISKTK